MACLSDHANHVLPAVAQVCAAATETPGYAGDYVESWGIANASQEFALSQTLERKEGQVIRDGFELTKLLPGLKKTGQTSMHGLSEAITYVMMSKAQCPQTADTEHVPPRRTIHTNNVLQSPCW